jgi:hypothetical protein
MYPAGWTLFGQVHAYAFLNLQCHGTAFSHAISSGSRFRLRSNGVVMSFCWIVWRVWKKNVLLKVNSATTISNVLPQVEYTSGILIHRWFSFWNNLGFFPQSEEHVYKITSSKTWSVDSATDNQRARKWSSSPKMFLNKYSVSLWTEFFCLGRGNLGWLL